MSQANFVYRRDQDSPPIGFVWLDYNMELINFTSGWTFELQLVTFSGTQQKVLSTGITGYNVEPNVVVDWTAGFFADVPVGRYMLHLKATGNDSKARYFSLDRLPTLDVIPAPTPVGP